MEKITSLELRDNKAERASARTAPTRQPVIAGATKEINAGSPSQDIQPLSQTGKLTDLHPRILAESLNLHGVRELNSPLAG